MPRGGDHYSGFGGGDDGLEEEEPTAQDDVEREIEVETTSTEEQDTDDETPSRDDLPHRVRHDSPKAERKETPFVLSNDDRQRLSELETVAEQEFSEKIYKMDVYLASLRAGLHTSDEQFIDEMERIGYGFFE